jgi:hypothetical protein
MKIYITVDDVVTSSGRYPERANSPELTDEVKSNIAALVDKVNNLLTEIKWTKDISISSGFRPSKVNANVKGAAKKSNHMVGMACDILDDGQLCLIIYKNQNIAKKHGLFLEDPRWTLKGTLGNFSGWTHLQTKKTSKQVFIPYSDIVKNPPNLEVEKLLK